MALVDFFQDVVAFVGFACLVQRAEVFAAFADAAMHEHRQVFALDTRCLRVQDQDALDQILQLAYISGPMVLLKQFDCVFGNVEA